MDPCAHYCYTEGLDYTFWKYITFLWEKMFQEAFFSPHDNLYNNSALLTLSESSLSKSQFCRVLLKHCTPFGATGY